MRDKEKVIEELNNFIKSEEASCLINGTDVQKKHFEILKYLNSLNKKLKVLIRVDSMSNCEYILKSKFKTGIPKVIDNLNIYVDSMQSKSQDNTPVNFNCIIIYPIASLKGIRDKNIVDILNHRRAEKIFWISNHDNYDYLYLKQICNIKTTITINNSDDEIHERCFQQNIDNQSKDNQFDKLLLESLSYSAVERTINDRYKLGNIYTSSMGHTLKMGEFDEYIFGGYRKTSTINIKVLEEKENNKYVLLTKEVKK